MTWKFERICLKNTQSTVNTTQRKPDPGRGVQLFCEYILKIGIQNGDKHCFRNFVAFTYVNDIKSNEIENSDFFFTVHVIEKTVHIRETLDDRKYFKRIVPTILV